MGKYKFHKEPPILRCSDCGCIGGERCGAKPLNGKLTCKLNMDLVCPCCDKIGPIANKKRWKNYA